MTPSPVQLPATTIIVTMAAIHEVSHATCCLAVGGHLGPIELDDFGGGSAMVLADRPWSEMLILAAGPSGTAMIAPFTRRVSGPPPRLVPQNVIAGADRLHQIEKAHSEMNLAPISRETYSQMHRRQSDFDKFRRIIARLILDRRIRRRPHVVARWWARARSRTARFVVAHRFLISYLALELQRRKCLTRDELLVLIADSGPTYRHLLPEESGLGQTATGPAAAMSPAPLSEGAA